MTLTSTRDPAKADSRSIGPVIAPVQEVITEYSSVEVSIDSDAAHRLLRATTGRITVAPTEVTGRWTITAGSHVGTVVAPGLRLLIRPKVDAANLFHLLNVDGAPIRFGAEVYDYERSADLLPAIATFYRRTLEQTLARGIARRYVEDADRLMAIRGRIDMPAYATSLSLPIPIACRFDEHTADIPLNRVVKAAAARLRRAPGVTAFVRQGLAALESRLDEVGPPLPGDLDPTVSPSRLESHYRGTLALARLVLSGSSISHDQVGGHSTAPASTFLVDMNVLFERFIEQRLRRSLEGSLQVVGQHRTHLDVGKRVAMRPDLVFTTGGRVVFVGDAKYKLTSDGLGRDRDYYQLLAYLTALDVEEGVLIYCQNDGSAPDREVVVNHAGKRLWTRAVNLRGTPAEVDAEIDDLARWIRSRPTTTT